MTTPEQIRQALHFVIDPELGINVVDLGLVYGVDVRDGHVRVTMTMTTPACPLGESLTEQAEATIWQNVQGLKSVTVDLVWHPPWQPSREDHPRRSAPTGAPAPHLGRVEPGISRPRLSG